jgi:hypothetical protein
VLQVSVGQSNGFMTRVFYAEGRLVERETVKVPRDLNTDALIGFTDKALKSVLKYLDAGSHPYTTDSVLTLEVGRKVVARYLNERHCNSIYEDDLVELLKTFNRLPVSVEVIYNKETGFLIADRYNKEKYVSEVQEQTSAVSWFDEEDSQL